MTLSAPPAYSGNVQGQVDPFSGGGQYTSIVNNSNAEGLSITAGTLRLTGSAETSGVTVNAGSAKLDLAGTAGSSLDATISVVNVGIIEVSSTLAQDVRSISGNGITQVDAGARLTADSLVQDTLIIGAGGSVTIRETTGAGGASAVPEPGTWVLIGTALLGWQAFRRRRYR